MSRKFYTDVDLQGGSRVINAKDGVNPQDYVTVAQLAAFQNGLAPKDNARLASTGNVNVAAPGNALDGVNFNAGDRFLLKDQTAKAENGIYVWNGPSAPATRAPDANTGSGLLSATVTIDEGTVNNGTSWRQAAVNITIGSTAINWMPFGVVSPPASTTTLGIVQTALQSEVDAGVNALKYVTPATLASYAKRTQKVTASVGDGSSTQFDVTHNIGTNDVQVEVYRGSSPFDTVECDVERPSTSIVRLRFAVAPAAGAFNVVISG